MNKSNKVRHLNRPSKHRYAMLDNLVTSLFYHERIRSTLGRVKVLRSFAEKLITKARDSYGEDVSAEKKLHHIRLVERHIKDKEVLYKLFNDIASRFKERPGGYTRIIKLGPRNTDKSEMALIELVGKKDLAELKEDRKKLRADLKKKKPTPKSKPEKSQPEGSSKDGEKPEPEVSAKI